jgi:hypothetical protein
MNRRFAVSEDRYEVVVPVGRLTVGTVDPVAGFESLNGKRVAFVWDLLFSGDIMMEVIAENLRMRWPDIEFVGHENFENIHGVDESRVVAELPAKLKDLQADAAVIGVGACGSCTPAVMRAVAEVEAYGIPAVGLLAEGFAKQGHAIGRAKGLLRPRIATYPGVVLADDETTLRKKSAVNLYPMVEQAFLSALVPSKAGALNPDARNNDPWNKPRRPSDTVFSGSLLEVQEYFADRLWSDGLPIIPPTRELVARMLERSPLPGETVLGELLPESREVTVWNIAVNGVMAGCKPELMPLLVAATKAVIEPHFRIQDAGATPGWEPQIIVSGPDLAALGLHHGQGLMKAFSRANSTLGRYLHLAFINLAGLRPAPGVTDKGSIGANFQIAIAEDSRSTADLGWPTLREEIGYRREDTVVAVQSVIGATLPIYTGGYDPEPHLQVIAEHIAGFEGHWSFTGVYFQQWTPLLVMSPGVARVFTRAGLSKADVANELARRAVIPAVTWETYPHVVGVDGFNLEQMVDVGTAPGPYGVSRDPNRLVPTISYPGSLAIVLGGDPDRNQSRYLVNNHEHGPRTAVKVDFA